MLGDLQHPVTPLMHTHRGERERHSHCCTHRGGRERHTPTHRGERERYAACVCVTLVVELSHQHLCKMK